METGKERTVLVTGARGFIGRATCKLLRCKGYRVIALDRDGGSDPLENPPSEPGEVNCDISEASSLRFVFDLGQIDTIVHLAAILPTATQRDPMRATSVNIMGSMHLLEMASRFKVRRFVFGSSISVYGSGAPQERVTETSRTTPQDGYGAAKVYVERMGESFRERNHVEFVSLRIGRVVGPGLNSTTSAWRGEIFDRLDTVEVADISLPYAGNERILLLHVEDVARMVDALVAAERLSYGVYNALCDWVVVSELKRQVEFLNPRIRLHLGNDEAMGNPRWVDASRFERKFSFQMVPIFEQLKRALEKG